MKLSRNKLFVVSTILLAISAFGFIQFLLFQERVVLDRGVDFRDPAFNFLPIADCSVPIFSITYGSLLIYGLLERKEKLFAIKLMIGYSILLMLRILTLLVLPLKEPESLVYLQDPFLNDLIYPGRMTVDLFFSGHTGLVLLIYFFSKRWIFILLATLLGFMLVIQRVHYSIDVLAAIPFAYLSSLITMKVLDRIDVE